MMPRQRLIVQVKILLITLSLCTKSVAAQSIEFDGSRISPYAGFAFFEGFHYNSPKVAKDYYGWFSLTGGLMYHFDNHNSIVGDLSVMAKAPFGECLDRCEFEILSSFPLAVRYSHYLLSPKLNLQGGAQVSYSQIAIDSMFDSNQNVISGKISDHRLSMGASFKLQYVIGRYVAVDLLYNPSFYDLRSAQARYSHSFGLFLTLGFYPYKSFVTVHGRPKI